MSNQCIFWAMKRLSPLAGLRDVEVEKGTGTAFWAHVVPGLCFPWPSVCLVLSSTDGPELFPLGWGREGAAPSAGPAQGAEQGQGCLSAWGPELWQIPNQHKVPAVPSRPCRHLAHEACGVFPLLPSFCHPWMHRWLTQSSCKGLVQIEGLFFFCPPFD